MANLLSWIKSTGSALKRARIPILTIAVLYGIAVSVGIIMVDTGSQFALRTRDSIVNQAYNGNDPTINALQEGNRLSASLSDFSRNLFIGAIPNTLGGLGVIFPYFIVAYRGWIGGIVSIDSDHVSRLSRPWDAIYYLVTLILQLIPYSLASGAGVQLGLAFYRNQSNHQIPKWLGIPKKAILDVARIYTLIIPLFLIASLWEFIMA